MIRKDCKRLTLKAKHARLPNVSRRDRLFPRGFGVRIIRAPPGIPIARWSHL